MKAKLLIPLLLLVLVGACKKSARSARSVQYTVMPQNNSGLAGTVTFKELIDSSKTEVDVILQNTVMSSYQIHLHDGPPTSYHFLRFDLGSVFTSGGRGSATAFIPIGYDSANAYNGTFVAHDSIGNVILATCGVGKNK